VCCVRVDSPGRLTAYCNYCFIVNSLREGGGGTDIHTPYKIHGLLIPDSRSPQPKGPVPLQPVRSSLGNPNHADRQTLVSRERCSLPLVPRDYCPLDKRPAWKHTNQFRPTSYYLFPSPPLPVWATPRCVAQMPVFCAANTQERVSPGGYQLHFRRGFG